MDGKSYYYDGNDFWNRATRDLPVCKILRPLEQVENIRDYNGNCDE